jgi:drug/metabolite transporter (DMT)-like permease
MITNCLIQCVVGFVQHNVVNMKQNERKIPMKYYALFAVLHVMMQGFTNLAMQYLNYPAKTLFKSSRVIVTMLFGGCFMGKRYSLNDYMVAMMIIVGLSVFTMSDAHTSPLFNHLGVVYIVIALIADAMILNIQEYCLNVFSAGHDELVYFTYLGSGFVAFIICIATGAYILFHLSELPSLTSVCCND